MNAVTMPFIAPVGPTQTGDCRSPWLENVDGNLNVELVEAIYFRLLWKGVAVHGSIAIGKVGMYASLLGRNATGRIVDK